MQPVTVTSPYENAEWERTLITIHRKERTVSQLEIMNQYYTIEIILKLYQIGIRFELGDGEIVGWREETHGKNL